MPVTGANVISQQKKRVTTSIISTPNTDKQSNAPDTPQVGNP